MCVQVLIVLGVLGTRISVSSFTVSVMRPSASIDTVQLFECPDCGSRERDPDHRMCEECDTVQLRNLGVPRDL